MVLYCPQFYQKLLRYWVFREAGSHHHHSLSLQLCRILRTEQVRLSAVTTVAAILGEKLSHRKMAGNYLQISHNHFQIPPTLPLINIIKIVWCKTIIIFSLTNKISSCRGLLYGTILAFISYCGWECVELCLRFPTRLFGVVLDYAMAVSSQSWIVLGSTQPPLQ